MQKIILIVLLLIMISLCGCINHDKESKQTLADSTTTICINGHVYLATRQYCGYYSYTPLFDPNTNIPTLVKCPKTLGGIRFEPEQ